MVPIDDVPFALTRLRFGDGLYGEAGAMRIPALSRPTDPPEHLELGRALFSRLGRALVLDEKYFDAVTGLSASGPAFI